MQGIANTPLFASLTQWLAWILSSQAIRVNPGRVRADR